MPKFKKGDRVRRINSDSAHIYRFGGCMKKGDEGVVTNVRGNNITLKEWGTVVFLSSNFELVDAERRNESKILESTPKEIYPCIKEIPAQAARTKVTTGDLNKHFHITVYKDKSVGLHFTNGCISKAVTSKDLRESAAAFIALADALDRAQRS